VKGVGVDNSLFLSQIYAKIQPMEEEKTQSQTNKKTVAIIAIILAIIVIVFILFVKIPTKESIQQQTITEEQKEVIRKRIMETPILQTTNKEKEVVRQRVRETTATDKEKNEIRQRIIGN
jgi:hypothetical protein